MSSFPSHKYACIDDEHDGKEKERNTTVLCDSNINNKNIYLGDHPIFEQLLVKYQNIRHKNDNNNIRDAMNFGDYYSNMYLLDKSFMSTLLSCRNISSRSLDECLLTTIPTCHADANATDWIESLKYRIMQQTPDTEYIIASFLSASPSAYDIPWRVAVESIRSLVHIQQRKQRQQQQKHLQYQQKTTNKLNRRRNSFTNGNIITSEDLSEKLTNNKNDHSNAVDVEGKLIRTVGTYTQYFLRETVAIWIEEERNMLRLQQHHHHHQQQQKEVGISFAPRKPIMEKEKLTCKTSRDWILQLMSEIMKLLLGSCDGQSNLSINYDDNNDDVDDNSIVMNPTNNSLARFTNSQFFSPLVVEGIRWDDVEMKPAANSTMTMMTAPPSPTPPDWSVLLDIMTTIIQLSYNLDKSLFEACLEVVFPSATDNCNNNYVDPMKLISWIQIAMKSQHYLREKDWDNMYYTVQLYVHRMTPSQRTTSKHQKVLPKTDLPQLAECLVSFSISTFTLSENSMQHLLLLSSPPSSNTYEEPWKKNNHFYPTMNQSLRWHQLIVELLLAAASNQNDFTPVTYCYIESALQSSLSKMSISTLRRWIRGLIIVIQSELEKQKKESLYQKAATRSTSILAKTDQPIPIWFMINILLLVSRSSRKRSGSSLASCVTHHELTDQTENSESQTDPNVYDLNSECWVAIGQIIRSDSTTGSNTSLCSRVGSRKRKAPSTSTICSEWCDIKSVHKLFENVAYMRIGRFQHSDKTRIDKLSKMGSYIRQCLFITDAFELDGPSCSCQYVSTRSQSLCQYSWDVLNCKSVVHNDASAVILAIVGIILVYFEIPSFRCQIVKDMKAVLMRNITTGYDTISTSTLYCCTICSVLLTSMHLEQDRGEKSSELDQLAEIFAHPTPLPIFLTLVKYLSPLVSVRRILFRISQEQLDDPSMAELWSKDKLSHVKSNLATFDPVKCGLVALLFLVSSSSWSDFEAQAWVQLSSFLVNGNERIPIVTRSWFLQEIPRFVQDNSFDYSTVQHLLRACIVRMLYFIGTGENGGNRFAYEKLFVGFESGHQSISESNLYMIEDIPSLFTVIFSLINFGAHKNRERSSLFISCCEIMESLIPTSHALLEDVDDDDNLSLSLRTLPDQISIVVSFHCLAMALTENNFLESADWALSSATKLKALFISEELNEIKNFLTDEDIPDWLKESETSSPLAHAFSQSQVGKIQLDILDLLVDVIVGQRLHLSNHGTMMDFTGSCNLCFKLSFIFAKKKIFIDSNKSMSDRALIAKKSSRKSMKLFNILLHLFAGSMENYIDNQIFDEVKEILTASLDLCETVSEILRERDCIDLVLNLQSLWRLYKIFCTENAAVNFISYLESRSCDLEDPLLFGISISSPHGVDCAVRYCRLTILRCISVHLSCFSWWKLSPSYKLYMTKWNRKLSSIDLVLEMVGTLSFDLRKGLEGNSGGVTNELFWAFVGCIEGCTSILQADFKVFTERQIEVALATCGKAKVMFEDIVCSFDIPQPRLFKKTMMLCTEAFSFAEKLLFSPLCYIDRFDSVKRSYCNLQPQFPMFCQVAEILRQRVELSSRCSEDWKDIVDANHLNEGDQEKNHEEASHVFGVKPVFESPKHKNSSRTKKLRLCRETAWTDSFCCLLEGFEKLWTNQALITSEDDTSIQPDHMFNTQLTFRKEELVKTLQSICLLFRKTKLSPDDLTDNNQSRLMEISIHALALPAIVKASLLSLVDRILMALQKGIKFILINLQEMLPDESTWKGPIAIEVISCLSAWLSSQNDEVEFTYAVHKWLAAENLLKTQSLYYRRGYAPHPGFIRRLPKTNYRLEEIELGLIKLSKVMKKSITCRMEKQTETLSKIDNLLTMPKDIVDQPGKTFLQLLNDKLEFIKRKKCELCTELGISDDYEQRKRLALKSGARKKRRQGILRSRNEVVDKWLQLDREKGPDNTLDNDTFIDLEDFIVDG